MSNSPQPANSSAFYAKYLPDTVPASPEQTAPKSLKKVIIRVRAVISRCTELQTQAKTREDRNALTACSAS